MKNAYFLLILFWFCTCQSISAQLQYGLKTGLHLGYAIRKVEEFHTNGFIDYDWKRIARNWPSPLVGVYANYKISPYLALQAELMGLHKTWRSDLRFFARVEQFEYTFLNLPFMFQFRSGNFGVELGPAFNYLIIRNNISPSKTIPPDPARLELAINAGFNFYFREWILGLRFTNDITPFFNQRINSFFRSSQQFIDYYHRGYQFSIAHQL
jgi:hypothetical protein